MSVCMEISKLFKSQSLLIIFAVVSSLAAKPQNSTSEGRMIARDGKKQLRSGALYGNTDHVHSKACE